jgi:hypothetical protein
MGVACASCGQVVPSGQFRCGHCGAVAQREELDDYGGLLEVAGEAEKPPVQPPAEAASPTPAPAPQRTAAPEEDDAREPLVPRGTFASELPDRAAEGDERELVKVEGGAVASKPNDGAKGKPASGSSQRVKVVRTAQRPPYLASEILREDLTPSEPGKKLLELLLYVAPSLGIAAALLSGLTRTATWVALVALTGLLALARFELPYATRAMLVALTGGGTLTLVSVWSLTLGERFDRPLLAAAATLLPAALLFRAWYRASEVARVLVAGSLLLALAWALSTSDRQLLSLVFDWQSWLPALTWYLFGLLCLLSLLAFMGDETTAGCDVWAMGMLLWYGVFAVVRFALESRGMGSLNPNVHTLGLIEPALAAPTAVALSQLFARSVGARARRAPTTL